MDAKVVTLTAQCRRTEARSKRFLMIVEGTGDAAFAVDAAGIIRAWNKAAAELFGRSEVEVIGVSCHELLQCSDEDGICSRPCAVERWVADNHPPVNIDLRLQTKVGKLWCNLSTVIASDQISGGRYAIHIVHTVEIRKRLEQALSEFVRIHVSDSAMAKPVIFSTPPVQVDVGLTPREVEVLKSLAKGHTTRAIANQLNISSATVKNHIKHILTKLGAHTRLQAIRHAETAGVI